MNIDSELFRLDFEDFLWVIFIGLAILNIYGDYDEKKYIHSHNEYYRIESNSIFTLTLTITFFIYLYFLIRNYRLYRQVPNCQKQAYLIRLYGSAFFFFSVCFLLYFQKLR